MLALKAAARSGFRLSGFWCVASAALFLLASTAPAIAADPELATGDPMLAGEETIDELMTPQPPASPLDWSDRPGVYESELLRRNGNPLYVAPRRVINETELRAAKRLDAERSWQALEAYVTLMSQKDRLARRTSARELGEALERIDATILLALETRGEAYPLALRLIELRAWLLGEWSAAVTDSPNVLGLLAAQAEPPFQEMQTPARRLLLELEMEEGPIQDFEMGAALLSEDRATVEEVVASLEEEELALMAEQSFLLLTDIEREGIEIDGIERKVAVIATALEGTSGYREYPADAGYQEPLGRK
jgi:hypothetical protein